MSDVNFYESGRDIGRELAAMGGRAILDEVGEIGVSTAKKWVDGVLDGLAEKGEQPKSIAISPELAMAFRDATSKRNAPTYRGVALIKETSICTLSIAVFG